MPDTPQLTIEGREERTTAPHAPRSEQAPLFTAPQTIRGQLNLATDAPSVVGRRHVRSDGRDCGCGCYSVIGLAGRVVQDSDTPKLAQLDPPMCIASFTVPCPAGGPAREELIAYTLAELRA